MGWLSGLAGGVSSVLGGPVGGLIGGAASALWESREAQKQMDFQERMSSTAYSRAMADLKNAGLNPLLAIPGPASSPGGAKGNIGSLAAAAGVGSTMRLQAATARTANVQSQYESEAWRFLNKPGNEKLKKSILAGVAGKHAGGVVGPASTALEALRESVKPKAPERGGVLERVVDWLYERITGSKVGAAPSSGKQAEKVRKSNKRLPLLNRKVRERRSRVGVMSLKNYKRAKRKYPEEIPVLGRRY